MNERLHYYYKFVISFTEMREVSIVFYIVLGMKFNPFCSQKWNAHSDTFEVFCVNHLYCRIVAEIENYCIYKMRCMGICQNSVLLQIFDSQDLQVMRTCHDGLLKPKGHLMTL